MVTDTSTRLEEPRPQAVQNGPVVHVRVHQVAALGNLVASPDRAEKRRKRPLYLMISLSFSWSTTLPKSFSSSTTMVAVTLSLFSASSRWPETSPPQPKQWKPRRPSQYRAWSWTEGTAYSAVSAGARVVVPALPGVVFWYLVPMLPPQGGAMGQPRGFSLFI